MKPVKQMLSKTTLPTFQTTVSLSGSHHYKLMPLNPWQRVAGMVGGPAVYCLCLYKRHQTRIHSSWGWVLCYLVWCGTCDTATYGEGGPSRQVIQDYSTDMSFLRTPHSCPMVFCVKHRVKAHLSAQNSPPAPINGSPWTSIDHEIMSSCCLVNAIPFSPLTL